MDRQTTQKLLENENNKHKNVGIQLNKEEFGSDIKKGNPNFYHILNNTEDLKKHAKCRRKLNFDFI
ncbi:ORF-149 peptide [Chrysodeixis chalcites nucleopolyhedrovirus]|uniref:ORF-149 peptide n=1 Tax=Chrysodeixis chalcites nucleopolyhedrovirus TaxID=320432 RepID=Q4KST2_9ABAC|nr:ORF-149 peptide [Chrysodeixis chalcites nucleopolyhedrovirus]AGC36362.1 hypothetical protein TF1A_00149 [Chrysodeixis chalcites SNPV TF1-A]AAY84080.1 ORF-149 peptide [Chrysodeixis chalcites nucleopolyhedrovirus]AGE61408.1 hypothetical protein [Chrysodeixis chalcites nucleopolyhedrovirus]AGE61553.1 hypothetical protein [Chrysodeixis chalcites nucleopolyhedrovirus]AGE61709.1 hypothetical protein [Chrysodeixis chalcites nucleopolyhedrovirus]